MANDLVELLESQQSLGQYRYGQKVSQHVRKFPTQKKSIQRLKPITRKSQKQEYVPGWKTPQIIRNALELCAHPLDLDSLNNNLLINIYSGEIAHDKYNVQNLVVIGSKELIEFSESLLDGFYATIQNKVVTMEVKGKKNGSFAGNDIK